jgi:hypothetical protein
MIDTLKVSLSDYEITSDADIVVQPSNFNAATGEMTGNYPLWHTGSRYVEGARAFHNSEMFNLTIKPVRPTEPDKMGCFVQFSVPKVATGSNYYPTDKAGTVDALKTIQKELKSIGVKTNLKDASLSRVDTFKTVQATEPYQTYHGVLGMLQGQRMAKRDYGTTFLWSNTQQEICVYDKLAEMQQRKCDVSRLPGNSIRFEHRVLKARKVRETFGMRSVNDLVKLHQTLSDSYRDVMEKQLFKFSVKEVELFTAGQIEAELSRIMRVSSTGSFGRWLQAAAVARGIPDVEAVRKAIALVAPNRTYASRARRQLDQAVADAASFKLSSGSNRTVGELYTELQDGVMS